ncbi:MAG: hypothetical protein IJO26_05170 [Clostridium sp.]|nr:hypothetical protein [Clostridium sp.]
MKKKLLLILLVSIPVIIITIVILFRLTAEPTNEEIIQSLKDINSYTTEVEFTFKNDRGEEKQEAIQYYKKDVAGKINFGEDRSKIYKDDSILVRDNISNKEYTIDKSLDDVYSLSFINNLLSNSINSASIEEGQEEWGEIEYIAFTSDLFLENDNLNSIRIFINKQEEEPIGAIIYDKNEDERVRIVYNNFEKLKNLDEELLK